MRSCYTPAVLFKRIFALLTVFLTMGSQASLAMAKTPDDTFYSKQWYLTQIGAERAWDRTTGSPVVVVAVVDTAMDIDHEDLKDNIWTNTREIFGNGIDDDQNGYVDDLHGWNFTNASNDVRPHGAGATEHGYVHATLVASLIAAKGNNGIGIAGIAWNARIMPLVALEPNGGGNTSDVANAVRYAADNGASVINLSLEGYSDASEVDEALSYARSKGVLTVAAAGNAKEPEGIDLGDVKVYPACLSLNATYGTFGVGSTDAWDRKAYFANYGPCIQVSAPGDDLFGAKPSYGAPGTSSTALSSGYGGGYSGTSLAAPLVAGAAALIKSIRPDWGWAEIREQIMSTADPVDYLQDPIYRGNIGRGRLNVAAAVWGVSPFVSTSTVSSGIPGDASFELAATNAGSLTRVRVRNGSVVKEITPFGANDRRGARTAFTDVDADGISEVAVVAASGRIADWAVFTLDGSLRSRGTFARDIRDGLLIADAGSGFIAADPNGGRAWGVASGFKPTLLRPYGATYRAGIDLVAVPGGVAFAPKGGGGHVVVMTMNGQRLASLFPFGKDARGRWSVVRTRSGGGHDASLVLSGPLGMKSIDLDRIGSDGWKDLTKGEFDAASPHGALGVPGAASGERWYDAWPKD